MDGFGVMLVWVLRVKTTFSVEDYARLYIQEVVILYGVPVSIISDRGAQVTAQFWKSFQKDLGSKVNLSIAFHPQTDGQVERTIQTLEDILRACVIDFKGNWNDHLPLIEFAYNNMDHSSIQMAPYETLYGRRCKYPIGWFEVGEAGLIGPELVHQAMEKVKILQERISKRIDNVAYELELPSELATVHPILDRQVRKLRTKEVASVKVLWRNQFIEEATWDDEEDMKKRYPHLFPFGEIPDQGVQEEDKRENVQDSCNLRGVFTKDLILRAKAESLKIKNGKRKGRWSSLSRGMLPLLALHTVTEYYRLDRKPPVTAALVAANTIIYLRPTFLHSILPTINQVWFNPHLILKYKDLERFFLSAFYHLDDSHLVYNMLSLLWKGIQLETSMGSAEFASTVAALVAMSQGITLLLAKSLLLFFDYERPYYQ
ncbi:hypothetical protein MTR67_022982 [Solanum verrucosum]|uniref:Integrase catalytic domain-containing protein n=1 Tax=Solanum verrucosum TaxID=315347 RepID=A0AAF0QVW3_SOLVR|nr:hypothetical protein MTR67_022982 [Solanum verrucosum]